MGIDLRQPNISSVLTGSQSIYDFNVLNHTALVAAKPVGDFIGQLAYVQQSEGTAWLPGSIGGTYYPRGSYVWDGAIWNADKNEIAAQLQKLNAVVVNFDPGPNNDSTLLYQIGQLWYNTSNLKWFVCQQLIPFAAVWREIDPLIHLNPRIILNGDTVQDLNTVAVTTVDFSNVPTNTILGSSVSPTGVVTLPAGIYKTSFKINLQNQDATRKNIGAGMFINGVTVDLQSIATGYCRNTVDDFMTLSLPHNESPNLNLASGGTVQVLAARLGSAGICNSIPAQSFWEIEQIGE